MEKNVNEMKPVNKCFSPLAPRYFQVSLYKQMHEETVAYAVQYCWVVQWFAGV